MAGSTWHEEIGRTTERLLGALSRRVLLARAQLLAEAAEELLRGADQGKYVFVMLLLNSSLPASWN